MYINSEDSFIEFQSGFAETTSLVAYKKEYGEVKIKVNELYLGEIEMYFNEKELTQLIDFLQKQIS